MLVVLVGGRVGSPLEEVEYDQSCGFVEFVVMALATCDSQFLDSAGDVLKRTVLPFMDPAKAAGAALFLKEEVDPGVRFHGVEFAALRHPIWCGFHCRRGTACILLA